MDRQALCGRTGWLAVRYRKRKDANQNPIAAGLVQAGYSVFDASAVGGGFTDLVVGGIDRRDGQRKNWIMEVKTDKGKLNSRQKEWHETWRGPVDVIHSLDDALVIVGVLAQEETLCNP